MLQTIFRLPSVKTESGYSRSTIYLRIAQGLWTKQVSLGPRCVGWPAHEVAALNAARIAGKTDVEIRSLVVRQSASSGLHGGTGVAFGPHYAPLAGRSTAHGHRPLPDR